MTRHSFAKHKDCKIPNCPICSGAVRICIVCGGAHSEFMHSLTEECYGKPLKLAELNKIAAKELDFKNGYFRNPKDGPAVDEVMTIPLGKVVTHGKSKRRYIYIGGHPTARGAKSHNFHPEVLQFSNRADDYISLVYSKQLYDYFPELQPAEERTKEGKGG